MTKQTNNVSQKIVNSFFDRGEGIVEFPNGLVITDDSVMWSGTKYDIESLNIDEYPGQLTLDHIDSIGGDSLIGKVEGVKKQGNRITVDRIRYAINASENARRAYNLLIGGFSNAFSIETVGPWADEETGVMHNHKLIGLSQVVMGNNKHAVANSIKPIVHQTGEFLTEDEENCSAVHEVHVECEIDTQVEEGKDVAQVEETKAEAEAVEVVAEAPVAEEAVAEEAVVEEAVAEEVVANEMAEEEVAEEPSDEKDDEVVAEPEVEAEPAEAEEAAEEAEVAEEAEEVAEEVAPAEEEAVEVENDAEPEVPTEEKEEPEVEEAVADDTDEVEATEPAEEEVDNKINKNEETVMSKEEITKLINEAIKNFADAQAEPVAEEPVVEEVEAKEEDNSYSLEKHANLIMRALKTKSALDYDALARINERNLNALKAAGKVSNAMTIADWGNFVLPPEMYDKIVGKRTDYSALLDATEWRETDRLEFAWLTRNGDIEMSNVAACEAHPVSSANKNNNLKPISTYAAVRHIEQMEHLGAVTPVCSAATKYLVVDLIADAIAGYRNNYDKKRAELVIAKLQEAVNLSGNKVHFDATGTNDEKLATFIDAIAALSDASATGTFLFTEKTLLKIMEYVTPRESALGDRCFDTGKDGIKRIFGTPYIVVPNALMPSLEGTAANPVISYIPVDASSTTPQNITITSPVFYGDLSLFTGYTSGGLQFDMTEYAAYEDASGVVRSAYQRDEIVLRGYFWRGACYRYPAAMAAITNEAVSD